MADRGRRPVITVESVSRRYRTGGAGVEALRDVSLSVDRGEFVSIVGPSGAGKSTLLHLVGALDRPSSGSTTVNDQRLESMDDRAGTMNIIEVVTNE
jgi:putative ABC transport system ATP-binding protein